MDSRQKRWKIRNHYLFIYTLFQLVTLPRPPPFFSVHHWPLNWPALAPSMASEPGGPGGPSMDNPGSPRSPWWRKKIQGIVTHCSFLNTMNVVQWMIRNWVLIFQSKLICVWIWYYVPLSFHTLIPLVPWDQAVPELARRGSLRSCCPHRGYREGPVAPEGRGATGVHTPNWRVPEIVASV